MSVDRGMDKEATLHVYTGILLSHEKEWKFAFVTYGICNNLDGSAEYYA